MNPSSLALAERAVCWDNCPKCVKNVAFAVLLHPALCQDCFTATCLRCGQQYVNGDAPVQEAPKDHHESRGEICANWKHAVPTGRAHDDVARILRRRLEAVACPR